MRQSSGIAVAVGGLTVCAGGDAQRSILGPLDLEIAAGEALLLVGPSGCGKTTLLRAIAGLETPSAGSVELFGERVSEAGSVLVPPERRGVGMLFQGGALWPHMSAARTLRFTLRACGRAASAERIAALLEKVRLDGFEERMPATLSGGEKQRLALARALAAEPRILLLDEPLGPLDRELRSGLLETLAELQRKEGWTGVHVTHDPDEVRGYAGRLVRMDAGRLLADDRIENASGMVE